MGILKDMFKKIIFSLKADRLGPDIPFTHWRLHFNSSMRSLCNQKFALFSSGADFRPGAYAIHCSHIFLGKNVVIRPGTMLFADEFATITIADDVMIGSGAHFYVNNHKFDDVSRPIIEQGYYPSKNVLIKNGAWIGANAIILPGVTVGQNSVVGAGSIVTKDIPDFCVAVGCPAKVIRNLREN